MRSEVEAPRTEGSRASEPIVAGFRLGSVAGVQVHVDWSLILIFTLVLANLGLGVLPRWHPDWEPTAIWGTASGAAVLFFASILAHELSHALVGRWNGIPVPRITLFLFGGMAHMEREPPSPRSEFLMAIAGPVTSLLIGIGGVYGGLALAGPAFRETLPRDPEAAMQGLGMASSLLLWLGPINILLGLFNVIPGFPLDGGRVLRSALWGFTGNLRRATLWASRGGRAFAWVLMIAGVFNLFGGAFLQGFWLILIGWFLNNAARLSYEQLAMQEDLRGVSVARLMRTRFASLDPGTTVEALVRDELMASEQRAFPVRAADGGLAGLVCVEDLRKAPKSDWPGTPVSAIMTPRESLTILRPDAPADQALKALQERDVNQIPVLDDSRVVGLVRRQDILKWLSLHSADFAGKANLR